MYGPTQPTRTAAKLVLTTVLVAGGLSLVAGQISAGEPAAPRRTQRDPTMPSKEELKKKLTPEQYRVTQEEGTERPFTSALNDEKRKGVFVCAGCAWPVFTSAMKYDSGTGWPSFFTTIPGAFETSSDFRILYPRIEYHCARCGGHHGHVFDDGPRPTLQRWCRGSNGRSPRSSRSFQLKPLHTEHRHAARNQR